MLLHRAIEYAAVQHRNQYRKGSDTPYISHLMEVLQILASNGCSQSVQIAGVLHDCVEDTSSTLEEIEALFGSDVAFLVDSDTEDKTIPWVQRKEIALSRVAADGLEAKQLLCADKLSNIKSLHNDKRIIGDNIWSRFKGSPSQTNWYYHEVIKILEPELSGVKMFEELKHYVRLVFDIEEN